MQGQEARVTVLNAEAQFCFEHLWFSHVSSSLSLEERELH